MKTTFKLICFALVAMGIMGCAKSELNEVKSSETTTMDAESAKKEFAKILSKAVYNEPSLRTFIKTEALKQFDRDYDVFYPAVKDKIVIDGLSFHDLLLKYCENPEVLETIEKKLPLLNLFVPDYSWIGNFCPDTWDVTEPEVAVLSKDNDCVSISLNGTKVGELDCDEIPDFPVIVVKNNERVRVLKNATKSSEMEYEFVDEAFDGSIDANTKALDWDHYYVDIYDAEPTTDYLSSSEIDANVIRAYNVFGRQNGRYQRDNIYYGMTNDIASGILNINMREFLYKIKFVNAFSNAIYDSTIEGSSRDGYFTGEYENKGKQKNIDELRGLDFRIEGNLELRFNVICGIYGGIASNTKLVVTVPVRDLFTFNKVLVEKREKSWIVWRNKYVYKIDSNCLVPKWYVVNKQLPISIGNLWNLRTSSSVVRIFVEEFDAGEEYTIHGVYTSTYSSTAGTEVTDGNVKNGYGTDKTETEQVEYTIKTTNQSDDLGDVYLDYLDPVILSANGGKYKMNVYSTGTVDMMIMPKRI